MAAIAPISSPVDLAGDRFVTKRTLPSSPPTPYWYRSASAGYTRAARRAGAYVVASAIA